MAKQRKNSLTGQCDKWRLPIYEGDLVQYHNVSSITKPEYWNPIYVVIWKNLGYTLKHIGGGKDSSNAFFSFIYYPETFEVIGRYKDTDS